MNEELIADIWTSFKEYLDKKHIEMAAERFIDLCADYGVNDETLKEAMGHDLVLDEAIHYYLDLDNEDTEEDDWD